MATDSHDKMSLKSGSKSPTGAVQRRRANKGPPEKKIADDEFMAAAIGDVEWLRQSLRGNRGAINFDKNVGLFISTL